MLKWPIGFCAAVAAAITLAPVRGHASSFVTQDLTGTVGPGVTSTAIAITIANVVTGLGSDIQPFDATLGTLDSVTITLMARAEQTITYASNNAPGIPASVNFTLTLNPGVPGPSTSVGFDPTGKLDITGLQFPSLPNGDFEVAANIPLGLTDNSTNANGGVLSNTSPASPDSFPGGDIDVQVVYAYTPTPVTTPLPAALPLFATGIGAMGLLGWRRKRSHWGRK